MDHSGQPYLEYHPHCTLKIVMLCFYKMYIVFLAQLSVLYQWESKVVGPVVSPLSHYYIDFIKCGICTTELPLNLKQSTPVNHENVIRHWRLQRFICVPLYFAIWNLFIRKSYLILPKHGRESLIWSYQNMVLLFK